MLLGFPFDYCEEEFIDNALAPFGRMLTWDKKPDHKTRLMVRARVVDLESVPHFIVFSETEVMESESWTIQVEIVQQNILGAGPSTRFPLIHRILIRCLLLSLDLISRE